MRNEPGKVRPQSWVYLKLYLSEAVDRCDGLIVSLIPKLLELTGIERWFFIRYLDEQGFHLRLRLGTRAESSDDLRERAWGVCHRALLQLPVIPPSDYLPMVPPPGAIRGPRPGLPVSVQLEAYEPELEKFGGKRGIPIAEELFEASSMIAFRMLSGEAQGAFSRKTMAPCFMHAVADAFKIQQPLSEFWQHYSFYWLGSRAPPAIDFRQRFFAKGDKLREGGIPVVAPEQALPAEARDLLQQWSTSLRLSASAYDRAGDLGETTPDTLAFNFAHLMNNRMGLYALEESYLAALLEQRALQNAPAP